MKGGLPNKDQLSERLVTCVLSCPEQQATLSITTHAAGSQHPSFVDKDTEAQGDDEVFLDVSRLVGRRAGLQIPAA